MKILLLGEHPAAPFAAERRHAELEVRAAAPMRRGGFGGQVLDGIELGLRVVLAENLDELGEAAQGLRPADALAPANHQVGSLAVPGVHRPGRGQRSLRVDRLHVLLHKVNLGGLLLAVAAGVQVGAVHVESLGVHPAEAVAGPVDIDHHDEVSDVPLAAFRATVAEEPVDHAGDSPLRVVLVTVLIHHVVDPSLLDRIRAVRIGHREAIDFAPLGRMADDGRAGVRMPGPAVDHRLVLLIGHRHLAAEVDAILGEFREKQRRRAVDLRRLDRAPVLHVVGPTAELAKAQLVRREPVPAGVESQPIALGVALDRELEHVAPLRVFRRPAQRDAEMIRADLLDGRAGRAQGAIETEVGGGKLGGGQPAGGRGANMGGDRCQGGNE